MRDINPFSNVKANDFSDAEIATYWVDIPGSKTVTDIVSPLDNMPMIIMGGKGSGKTHLIRYFSYPVQKVKSKKSSLETVRNDGYIGIYTKCGGLNADRFSGKGLSLDAWKGLYAYHFELWLAHITLTTISDIFNKNIPNEVNLSKEICKLLNLNIELSSIDEILSLISTTQQKLDYEINNYVFTNELSVTITTTPGDIFYNLPQLISSTIEELEQVKVLYLIDELENLLPYQQSYLQTLVRDRKVWTLIKLGVRRYGIKSYETLSGEKNLEDSEYQVLRLDDKLFNDSTSDTYKDFVINLCTKRLLNSGLLQDLPKDKYEYIKSLFQEDTIPDTTSNSHVFSSGTNGKTVMHLKKILQGVKLEPEVIDTITKKIAVTDMPILERFSAYLFYKEWHKSGDILKSSDVASITIENFIRDKDSEPQLEELISKFKIDLYSQLYRSHGKRLPYSGIDTIARISKGFPRNLLVILKNIYISAKFNGETPFKSASISIESQIEGILESSKWYLEESTTSGENGRNLRISIERLAEIFRINRYSDKPSECSLRCFSVDFSKCTQKSKEMIKSAATHSLIIKDYSGRLSKSSEQIEEKYIINPILSPYWGLPISTRGVIKIEENLLNSIFDPDHVSNYEELKAKFSEQRNAPFRSNESYQPEQGTLGF